MSYNSVLKSFTDRGPNKRKVKPVEAQMLNFSFGGSDSEEDEDFKVGDDQDGSGSEGSNADSESGSESSDSDEDEDDEGEKEEEKEEEKAVPADSTLTSGKDEKADQDEKVEASTPMSTESNMTPIDTDPKGDVELAREIRKQKLLVCGICLEHRSSEEDELIQCDACGMVVHEGCYGDIGDNKEDDDSDSDSPTEPWFCESCKANVSPSCELCPVSGGIFKQTDTGKWVHLVCALYTPGVGFRDVTSLQTVVLEDVQASKWGAKECLLCEDSRFCKTGICIGCDAGLCRSHFHVTCAQKNGLLSEIPNVEDADEDMADPLYAHCKQHADSNTVKSKVRSWLSYTSEVKNFKPNDDPDEKIRMSLALNKARTEYKEFRRSLNPPLVPKERVPRFLSTCPDACQKLTRKAEMLGYSVESAIEISKMITSSKVSRTVNPTLSCEFINYFYNRESKLKSNTERQEPLKEENEKLKTEQLEYQVQYEKTGSQVQALRKKKEEYTSVMNVIQKALERILDTKLAQPAPWLPKPKPKTPAEKEVQVENIIHTCFRCKGINDQHLMTDCDVCHNFYHLSCCIPPLSRMPKKSSKYLWQCYECDPNESSPEEEEAVDTGDENMAVRRPRRNVMAPSKFDASLLDESIGRSGSDDNRKKRPATPVITVQSDPAVMPRKRGRPRKPRPGDLSAAFERKAAKDDVDDEVKHEEDSFEPSAKRGRASANYGRRSLDSSRSREKPKQEKPPEECWSCKEGGESDDLVKCDECGHCFHFKTCLDPPYSKTPKRRGYGWICMDCDKSSDESGEENVVKEETQEEEETKNEKNLRSRKESGS